MDKGSKAQLAATSEFSIHDGNKPTEMLGTYSPVTSLDWAVVVQKPREDAYRGIYEMQRTGRLLAWLAVFVSVGLSILSARRITSPLQVLAQSSRAIARGDFSQRVHVKTRTEIGELATTFNTMSEDLEQFVEDLKRAADENKDLFMGSIQMLAGAIDEKDPYTRGHSDRVTKYSMMIAKEMGLDAEFLEILARIGATARRRQNRDRRPHPEKEGQSHSRRIRDHEDAHHAWRKHPASGAAIAQDAAWNRVAPRGAGRQWISLRS